MSSSLAGRTSRGAPQSSTPRLGLLLGAKPPMLTLDSVHQVEGCRRHDGRSRRRPLPAGRSGSPQAPRDAKGVPGHPGAVREGSDAALLTVRPLARNGLDPGSPPLRPNQHLHIEGEPPDLQVSEDRPSGRSVEGLQPALGVRQLGQTQRPDQPVEQLPGCLPWDRLADREVAGRVPARGHHHVEPLLDPSAALLNRTGRGGQIRVDEGQHPPVGRQHPNPDGRTLALIARQSEHDPLECFGGEGGPEHVDGLIGAAVVHEDELGARHVQRAGRQGGHGRGDPALLLVHGDDDRPVRHAALLAGTEKTAVELLRGAQIVDDHGAELPDGDAEPVDWSLRGPCPWRAVRTVGVQQHGTVAARAQELH